MQGLRATQAQLPDAADDVGRTYFSDIERGTRNVSLVNIKRLAAALALPMSGLFQLVERS